MTTPTRRPCLALPFTLLTAADTVRLVAGEDFRYTLTAPGLDGWLPPWLERLDGRRTLDETLLAIPAERRADAVRLAERLYGERVLIDGPPALEPDVIGRADEKEVIRWTRCTDVVDPLALSAAREEDGA